MGASLSLSVSESSINVANNTSRVTVTLRITATGETWNGYSQPGYIMIDGAKYSFSHGFSQGTTTTLATKSRTITHNADGSKTITVKGYYQTGVSAGNLSKTTTRTLTKINRSWTVTLDAQGGSGGGTYTKYYGKTLTLPTPTRTGYTFVGWYTGKNGTGTSYGTSYTANASITLYAFWRELTASISYYNTETGKVFAKDTSRYSTAYVTKGASSITRVGYTLRGWSTNSSGQTVTYGLSTRIKAANVKPTALNLYTVWNANSYQVSFDANGGSGTVPSSRNVTYKSSFTFPSGDGLSKSGFEFKGWSTVPTATTPQYYADSTISFNIDSNVTFYAVWGSILLDVVYYRNNTGSNFNVVDSYVTAEIVKIDQYSTYTIPSSIVVPNLENYIFTGFWCLNYPNQVTYTELGVTFPIGIIPYDYEISENDNFLTAGSVISSVSESIQLFPIYRDNTKPFISVEYSTYEYVKDSITEIDYYLYLTGQTSSFESSVVGDNVITQTRLKSDQGKLGVSLDTSEVVATLKADSEEDIEINLNPIFLRTLYNGNIDSNEFYVLFRNTGIGENGKLQNPSVLSYILTITGLKDGFGKQLDDIVILISPPKIVRDVNVNGDAVAFFMEAPDYSPTEKLTTHTKNELWLGGLNISNGFLIDDEDFENLLIDLVPEQDLENLYTIGKIDISKLFVYILSNWIKVNRLS